MIEKYLYSHLSDNVLSVAGRIFPLVMPQDCIKPALVSTVVYDVEIETLGCSVGNNVRFQIDLYSESYSQAKRIKQEIKTALKSFTK
jgi:hypothetical protein